MRTNQRRIFTLTLSLGVLALLVLATPGSGVDPPSGGTVEDVNVLCQGGNQTVKISPLSAAANLKAPDGCQCFLDAATAEQWMQQWIQAKLTPSQAAVGSAMWYLELPVEPGEQETGTLFCYSPEQLAAYEETLRALASNPSGTD